jgi:hypothetical protein
MLVIVQKMHRSSQIVLLWRERALIIVRFVKSHPSPGLAAGAFSLLAVGTTDEWLRENCDFREEGLMSRKCVCVALVAIFAQVIFG